MVLEMADIALESFDRKQLEQFYWSQASGDFFTEFPMRLYGGNPIGFLTAFSMSKAIALLCCQCLISEKMDGIVDFNSSQRSCRCEFLDPLRGARS